MLRPEELEAVPPEPAGLAGVVDTCSFFGAHFEIMVQTPLGPCRLHVREPRAPGDTMGIRWPDRAGIAYPWEEVSPVGGESEAG
jgi:hypothetical protein